MIGVVRAYQKMQIYKALLRSNIEAHLDIRKDQLNARQSPLFALKPQNLFIEIRDIVIGNRKGFDFGRRLFQRREIVLPGIRALELIVQHRARRMNMRLPAVPLRSFCQHSPS